jgi:hypothetical protein
MDEVHNVYVRHQRMMKVVEFVLMESNNISRHFSPATINNNHIRTFGLLMNDRLTFSSEGLKELLKSFQGNNKLEYSIGLVLRSCMLDTLILLQVKQKYIEGQ